MSGLHKNKAIAMNVGLYARVSKEEQARDERASIQQQIADMKALCERNGWNEDKTFVDCENYQATQSPRKGQVVNPSGERADRPAFVEMLDLIKTGELDAIVCWRDDRLVRHPRVAVALEDALDIGDSRRNGGAKVKVHDATGGEIDRFTLSIKAAIWREENKRRVERVKMGRIATLQQGRWPGTYDRLGYDIVKEEGRRGRQIVLAADSEVQIVKDIFDWYDQGVGLTDIRRRLLADGRQTKRHHKNHVRDWAHPVINGVLRAKDYTGKATWHFSDGTEYSIEIPCIIETEQWQRVQEKIDRNKQLATRNAKGVYLLQGMLRCGECNGGVSVNTIHYNYALRRDGTYKRYTRREPVYKYRCTMATRYPDEPHPSPYHWLGEALDWAVWRYIVDSGIMRPDMIQMQVLARQEELQRQGDNVAGEIAHARRRLAEVHNERAFYQRQAARAKLTEREFDARMDETEDAQRYWTAEVERLTELRDDAEKVQSGLDYALNLLDSLREQLPAIDQTPEELKALPEDDRNGILEKRRKIVRALCQEVIIWADGQVELVGVIDGNEGSQFELVTPRTHLPKLVYSLLFSLPQYSTVG